jgi:hypothetical protein
MLAKKSLLVAACLFTVYSGEIRNLADNTDNCAQYGYLDNQGNINDKMCLGCKKVCVKCDKDFYLDDNYRCRRLPKNCVEADKKGKCTKCAEGYFVDKDSKCQIFPPNCIKVDENYVCSMC